MLIQNIKKLNKNKYKVIIGDRELILYEDVLIKYKVLSKKNMDNKLLKDIEKDNEFIEIYETSLRYLDIKMRLEKELRGHLDNKFDLKSIEKVIKKLKKEGYIDDSKYVKSYISDKINLSNDGPHKIKKDLINKGVKEELIIMDVDSSILKDKLKRIMQKYININKKNSLNVIKNKVMNHFTILGYDKEMIEEVFNSLDIKGNSEKIKTDYEKIKNKYSKKYSDYKLESIIKQKLYQKGYSIDEINSFVEE